MIFNRLFCNRGILIQNFRQHGWIGILYLITLLFSLPLYIGTQYREVPLEITSLFQANEIHLVFALTFPVAIALLLFRYIQTGAPADLYHSLPLQRKHLLTMNLLTGYVMILLPIWITTGITGWVWAVLDQPSYIFSGHDIWMWGVTMSIFSLFMFTLTVAVGMCIGQSILQGLTVFGLILIPVIFWGVYELHLQRYLLGFTYNNSSNFNMEKTSLLFRMSSMGYYPPEWGELGIYAAITCILFVLCYVLYARRHVESATQAITFRIVKPIFRFGFMFTLVLLGGAYFTRIAPEGSGVWGIFGYLLGSVVGYIGAEMIIRKTWLIWSSRLLPRFAVYGIVAGLILYIPVADWNGYANNVPSKENVQMVRLGGDHYIYVNDKSVKLDDSPFYSDTPGYVDAVLALHQKIVHSDLPLLERVRNQNSGQNRSNDEYVLIDYQLNNGKTITRRYQIPEEEFRQELAEVKQWEDYKSTTYDTYALDEDVRSIGIRSSLNSERKVFISDPKLIREFKELLKSEILNQTYEDQLSSWEWFASIEVNQDYLDKASPKEKLDRPNHSVSYQFKVSYGRLMEWLKQNNLYDQLTVSAEDMASAQFVKQEIDNPGKYRMVYPEPNFVDVNIDGNRQVATKNKKIISDLLLRQRTGFYTDQDTVYQIKLNSVRGPNIYMMLKEEDLTEEMKVILVNQ
ncbi:hypothetical protein [Paenibacillus xylanexedens]|uniref:hypothetical protein n=1 Tax=Paenibacillus xylanexedens TaxID=528191 RepID=UPI003CFD0375